MYDATNYDTPVAATDVAAEVATLSTTSAKIRYLAQKGYTRGQIAKALNIRYQWVRNVLITPVKG